MITIRRTDQKIGEILIESSVLTRKQLDEALAMQDGGPGETSLGDILVSLGFAEEEDVMLASRVQYKIPYVPARNYEIKKEVLNLIPAHVAHKHALIPLDRLGNILVIALSNPHSLSSLQELRAALKCYISCVMDSPSEIRKLIAQHYGASALN
jgi:type IV pilus assembly protein PilB